MICIIHAALILPDSLQGDGMVIVENGKILYAGEMREIPDGAEVIDAHGAFAGPGFVDIHCHGGGRFTCGENPAEFARHFLKRGTTSILPSLGYGQEPNARLQYAANIVAAMKECPSILGIHAEGPFKNPNFGFPGKYQTPATLENAINLFDACQGQLLLMMAAPDTENIEPILAEMQKRGIRLAAGHGNANREQYALFKRYGLVDATHHYCASGDYADKRGVRKVALDELVDLDDDVYAEIIPDHIGAHVAPERIKLCIRMKGVHKIIIITDSVSKGWNQETPYDNTAELLDLDPTHRHSAEECDIHWVNTSLDGSELNMAKAAYNMKRHSGLSTEVVWRMASQNPAEMLGVSHRVGKLIAGADADILIADGEFNLKNVISKGVIIR